MNPAFGEAPGAWHLRSARHLQVMWLVAGLVLAACGPATATLTPAATQPPTVTAQPTATVTRPASPTSPPASPTPSLQPSSTLTAAPTATPTPAERPSIQADNAAQTATLFEIRFSAWELALAVAWSPDGELLAAAAGEAVWLYRSSDWSQAARLEVGALSPSLAFSPDGLWLAAGSRDGVLRVWSVPAALAQAQTPPAWQAQAHKKGINAVVFSLDGALLASGGNDAVARVWDADSGQVIGTTIGGTFAVPALAFMPDGQTLAVVNGAMIRLRQVGTQRILGSFQAEAPLFSVAFSPDGRLLCAGDNTNRVLVWDVGQAFRSGQTEYPEPVVLAGHNGQGGSFGGLVWQVTFSPDGLLLASAGGDGTLRIWGWQAQTLLATLAGHSAAVTSAAFSPDGKLLASGSLDGSLRIWGVK